MILKARNGNGDYFCSHLLSSPPHHDNESWCLRNKQKRRLSCVSSAANGDGRSTRQSWHSSCSFGLSVEQTESSGSARSGSSHPETDAQRDDEASAGWGGCCRRARQDKSHCCRWLRFLLGWKRVLLAEVAEWQLSAGSCFLPKYQARGLMGLSLQFLKTTLHSALKASMLEEIQVLFSLWLLLN